MKQTAAIREEQLVVFRLGKEEYGLSITQVQEINRLTAITHLPRTPSFVEGIINLRGRVIPVIDLRKRFELEAVEHTEDTRIIIVEVSGQTVGIVVDAVTEVIRIPVDAIEPPPPVFILDAAYLNGLGKLDNRLIILLNIEKILTSQEKIMLKEMELTEAS